MGNEESVPISPPPPGFEYFALALTNYYYCKFRAIFPNQADLSIIRDAILQNWGQGIESESQKCDQAWSFKLRGYPFTKGTSAVQAACSRRMMCQVFQYLNNAGLELKIVCDLTRLCDLSTFYFCRTLQQRPIQYPILCVGLSSTDKLQLVNLPDNMLPVIKDAIMKSWSRGIQSEEAIENAYVIKLRGNPWWSQTDEGVQARLLLVTIISALAQQYWVFHGAANIKSTSDSLFFKYDPQATGPDIAYHHFILSLNNTDKLRLINAPPALFPVVRNVISSVWTVMGGIQREQDYYGSWEYKLSGNPWWSYGNEAVMARFLICKILEAMRGQGWSVKTSVDVSRSSKDKSVLVFAPSSNPDTTSFMCLSFSDTDKIRLINAPQDLVSVSREILVTRWYKGIAREEQMNTTCSSYEFKLNGNPWHGYNSQEVIHIRSMLCFFLQAFAVRGWKYVTSADVSAKYQKDSQNGPTYPVDVHSWWFAYEPGTAAPPPSSFMPPPPSYDQIFKQ